VTSCEIDLRVGGRWRYVMVADGGFEVAFHGEFREIVPNEKIVTTEVYEMPDADDVTEAEAPVNVVTFAEADRRTTLTILVRCPSKDVRDAILASGMEAGMQEGLDLIEQIVATP
jgi:uncharacterized protein YndB with AHSA1/START domain